MTSDMAKMIDHTLLKADATEDDIKKVIEEAKTYSFASVCLTPSWVKLAADALKDAETTKVCTVIGFPLGTPTTETKAFEASNAVKNGAAEVDMVINIGALKSGQFQRVEEDIQAVVSDVKGQALVKVIIEACLLTDKEKVKACELAVKAGADFVKTSTGFSTGGATTHDVAIMRKTVGPDIGVKASGGIKTLADAQSMIQAGATRIGASSSVSIVQDNQS